MIDDVCNALDEQTVIVRGTGTPDVVIPSLARALRRGSPVRHRG
ncbi:hypothetical protein [Streptomyces sp. ME19-01-6]|nr:hypothetical protein [Streptomyces sp. ME19-01-6]MDX3233411.1 hypothetical protein [Streptomyces sp. ME19-01-6]